MKITFLIITIIMKGNLYSAFGNSKPKLDITKYGRTVLALYSYTKVVWNTLKQEEKKKRRKKKKQHNERKINDIIRHLNFLKSLFSKTWKKAHSHAGTQAHTNTHRDFFC